MSLVNKVIKVPKEASELSEEISLLLVEIIRAKRSDNKLEGKELLQIATYLISKLGTIVDGIDLIPAELKAEPYAFALSWAASGQKIADELNKPVPEIVTIIQKVGKIVARKKKKK